MSKKRRPHGFGGVYQRGRKWVICYPCNGDQMREGGFRTKELAAEKLRDRLAEIAAGKYAGPDAEKLTVDVMLDDYLKALKKDRKKSIAQIKSGLKHIRKAFGKCRAVHVKTAAIRDYIDMRLEDGAADATVNRSLQSFRAAYRMKLKDEDILRVPHFPLLPESNARQGFFEQHEHGAIKSELPDPHRDIAEFGYRTGWRRGEIPGLRWEYVDDRAGEIRLPDTKNGKPRTCPISPDIEAVLKMRRLKRGTSGWVFHVGGHRVWNFSDVWRAAAVAAGFPGRLFHDYRRTAARDLVRAGVTQGVAMTITGHVTASVFERYNITDTKDQREALAKLSAYRNAPLTHRADSASG